MVEMRFCAAPELPCNLFRFVCFFLLLFMGPTINVHVSFNSRHSCFCNEPPISCSPGAIVCTKYRFLRKTHLSSACSESKHSYLHREKIIITRKHQKVHATSEEKK